MAFLNGFQSSEAQVCMTLSSIAYLQENSKDYSTIQSAIESYLNGSMGNFATGANWELVWLGISPDYDNLMFMAANKNTPGQYAITHRGTDWNFLDDIIEDLEVYKMVPWPYAHPVDPSIQLAKGAIDGLDIVNSMTSNLINTSAPIDQPISLIDYLNYLATSSGDGTDLNIYVTGHSLGAALATVYTSWLLDTASQWTGIPAGKINIKTYTFAAPTVGNAAYAGYYNSQIANSQVGFAGYRVHNQQDLVPYAFGNLAELAFNGIPMTLELRVEVEASALVIIAALEKVKVSYQQVGELSDGSDQPLNNDQPQNQCAKPAATLLTDYRCWVGYEHGHNTYLSLLGAPDVPLNIVSYQP